MTHTSLLAASLVRDVPDYPKPGIVFKDITPVVQDAAALQEAIDYMVEWGRTANANIVAAIEARGFIFGAPIALELGVGLAPIRKFGKLPYERVTEQYELEYGTSTVEIHTDSIRPGQRVLIVDDLLATGGTAAASARLVEKLGGTVAGFCFLIELAFLPGRKSLAGYDVHALIRYD